jgi:hypothetical protein
MRAPFRLMCTGVARLSIEMSVPRNAGVQNTTRNVTPPQRHYAIENQWPLSVFCGNPSRIRWPNWSNWEFPISHYESAVNRAYPIDRQNPGALVKIG